MKVTTLVRRAALALVPVLAASAAVVGPAHASLDSDHVTLKGNPVDFGGDTWNSVLKVPNNAGRVNWSVTHRYYTPELTGYLYLHNAKGKYARMHIGYFDGAGGLIDVHHGGIVHATDDDLHAWSVDLWPETLYQIVEVEVCTEISDDGSAFTQVNCQTEYLN